MKNTVIMPNASAAGLFKYLLASGMTIDPAAVYTRATTAFFIFEPNLTHDPLIATARASDFFTQRQALRQRDPQRFSSPPVIDWEAFAQQQLDDILTALQPHSRTDIWIDPGIASQVRAIYLLNALTESADFAPGTLRLCHYPLRIAEQSETQWQPAAVSITEVSADLIDQAQAIWQALSSETPDAMAQLLHQRGAEDRFSGVLQRFLSKLPERKTRLTLTERELLTLLSQHGPLHFSRLGNYHAAGGDDDFTNWMDLPLVLDSMKAHGLVTYGNQPPELSLKQLMDSHFFDPTNAYDQIEILMTGKGRNRLAGNLTPADRQSTGWLWDEAAQRPVWESSPPLRWQPLR